MLLTKFKRFYELPDVDTEIYAIIGHELHKGIVRRHMRHSFVDDYYTWVLDNDTVLTEDVRWIEALNVNIFNTSEKI